MPAEPARHRLRGALRDLGRALRHRNYRLFFAGQGLSLIGTWMTRLATGWLIFRIAGSEAPFLLGVNGFAGQIPAFFLAPVAGALVDRWDRRRTLLLTQALALVQSALLALVAFTHQPPTAVIWEVIALSFFQGLINAFDMPTRQAFVVEMVEGPEDMPNAIALNSSLVNGARLVGPALAGLLIALASEGWCFLIDAVSYLAVLAALFAMRVSPRPRPARVQPVWRVATEGFRYAFGFAPIRAILLLLALVGLLGNPYRVLLPLFAADVLHGGSLDLGLLTGASGIGALGGAVFLGTRRTVLGLGLVIVAATVTFGLGLVGLALSRVLWLSLLVMLPVGFGLMVEMAATNTVLQTVVDEDKRGRVMSFYSMAIQGTTPFGSLLLGALAGSIGAPAAVLIGGGACLVGAALFAIQRPRLREQVRPIYVRLGILPQVATGMQAAAELTQPPGS